MNRPLVQVGLIYRSVLGGRRVALPVFDPRNLINLRYSVDFTEHERIMVAPGYGKGILPLRGNQNQRCTLNESGEPTQEKPPILGTFQHRGQMKAAGPIRVVNELDAQVSESSEHAPGDSASNSLHARAG